MFQRHDLVREPSQDRSMAVHVLESRNQCFDRRVVAGHALVAGHFRRRSITENFDGTIADKPHPAVDFPARQKIGHGSWDVRNFHHDGRVTGIFEITRVRGIECADERTAVVAVAGHWTFQCKGARIVSAWAVVHNNGEVGDVIALKMLLQVVFLNSVDAAAAVVAHGRLL